jgi:hypothetical protein
MSTNIEIIPRLYITSNLCNNNIMANIITINSEETIKTKNKVLDIKIDINDIYIQSSNEQLKKDYIKYNLINEFIETSFKDRMNIIIYSEDLLIAILICMEFLTKYLDINFIESVYYICKKLNININKLPKKILFDLFNYTK